MKGSKWSAKIVELGTGTIQTGEKKLCKSLIYSWLPTWNSLTWRLQIQLFKGFHETIFSFLLSKPMTGCDHDFLRRSCCSTAQLFPKKCKDFFFSLTHGGRDEGVIFSLMFHFSQRKRTDNMKLTQNKAQKVCAVGQNGLWPSSTHTQKRSSEKVEKDTKRGRSISCSCHFFHGWNYCFPWLFALLDDHLPVVSWRQCLGTKPSSHAGMSSDEIIWGGNIQTDVEDKGLPSQPRGIIYWKKLKQSMNPTKDQNEAGNPGSPHALDLQGRNFSFHLKTELNFSLK